MSVPPLEGLIDVHLVDGPTGRQLSPAYAARWGLIDMARVV